jgi:hypothetical protein
LSALTVPILKQHLMKQDVNKKAKRPFQLSFSSLFSTKYSCPNQMKIIMPCSTTATQCMVTVTCVYVENNRGTKCLALILNYHSCLLKRDRTATYLIWSGRNFTWVLEKHAMSKESARVARFFLVQITKMWKNIADNYKIQIPNGRKNIKLL